MLQSIVGFLFRFILVIFLLPPFILLLLTPDKLTKKEPFISFLSMRETLLTKKYKTIEPFIFFFITHPLLLFGIKSYEDKVKNI